MPNEVDVTRFSLSYVDRNNEKSSASVNIASQVDEAAYISARDAYLDAVDDVVNGNRYRYEPSAPVIGSSLPPDNNSFRENKWLVRYQDSVTFKRGTFTIPTADPSAITFEPNSDFIDLDDAGVGKALKDAIEAFVTSEAGNAITVINVEYSGRNL